MASSRKPPNASLAVALSGGVDSVVLLHWLNENTQVRLQAVHIHHGLSPNADAWVTFCRKLCRSWNIPFSVQYVKVRKSGKGLEAAAREARYRAFGELPFPALCLAHHLDDQAETVLMNLLRGAGARGASGMASETRFQGKTLLRPLLEVPRESILDYARRHRLDWIEDESNADESLTRNFVRRRLGPLIESRFPGWKTSLARAARHFSKKDIGQEELLRRYLRSKGLKAPSEKKLVEMLKQLGSGGSRTLIEHDGARLRVYRGAVSLDAQDQDDFIEMEWNGENKLVLPGGELRFKRVRGRGFDASSMPLRVRRRVGGERLQPDARRPRRTLKNLFQEAGVPPWERDRLPLLFHGADLVWVPGLGVEARFQTAELRAGWLPEWRPNPLFLRNSGRGHAKIAG